mgnify:CR=1 FL=1
MTEEFDVNQLQKSVNVVGYLYPILKTRSGKTLDGIHRKQIDPKWPEKIVDVESPYQEALIRLWANYRRKVSSEEVRQLIIQMAEELMKQGYKPGQIVKKLAEETPYSERWIYSFLPSEYKKLKSAGRRAERNSNIIEALQLNKTSLSGKDTGSGEDEVERVRREVREYLDTPEQQEMIRKDAEVLAKHAKEFLMKPPKSFKKKQVLGVVEDALDADLITPKDLIKLLIKTKRISCPYAKKGSLPPCCKAKASKKRRR